MNKNKLKKYFYILTLSLAFGLFFEIALAQDNTSGSIVPERPTIQVEIGNFGSNGFSPATPESCYGGSANCISVNWISEYIAVLYQYGVGVAGFLAVLMIMIGGFIWLTSAGGPARIAQAKDFISSALLGLLLALFSFVILLVVNPRLVSSDGITISSPADTAPFEEEQVTGSCCVCTITIASYGPAPVAPITQCYSDQDENVCLGRRTGYVSGSYTSCRFTSTSCGAINSCPAPRAPVNEGGDCFRNSQCAEGLICIDNDYCGQPRSVPSGGDCSQDEDCVSGVCKKPYLWFNTCE